VALGMKSMAGSRKEGDEGVDVEEKGRCAVLIKFLAQSGLPGFKIPYLKLWYDWSCDHHSTGKAIVWIRRRQCLSPWSRWIAGERVVLMP
jgi:hypothetical protein